MSGSVATGGAPTLYNPAPRRARSYHCAGRAVVAYRLTGQVQPLSMTSYATYSVEEVGVYNLLCITAAGGIAQRIHLNEMTADVVYDMTVVRNILTAFPKGYNSHVFGAAAMNAEVQLRMDSVPVLSIAGLLSEYDEVWVPELLAILNA